MAWDFGCGDIVAGIRIALTLYEYGFVEENAPDYIYHDFKNDILNFGLLLERLDRSLRDAKCRYHDGGLFARARRAYDPLDDEFEAERIAIVGNFKQTLRDCERVLKDNEKFRAHYANAFESLEWHLTQQQKRIDDLRRRLYFHCEKIRLVIDRLSITLLTEADSKLDDILAITNENLKLSQDILDELRCLRYTLVGDRANSKQTTDLDVHAVSPALARRFEDALTIDAPDTFTSELPLIEACDALYFRFEQSVQGFTQTPEKYLHLLKCRWLLAQIKASPQYQEAAPAFHYRRAVNQIDLAIRTRVLRSGDLVVYKESELLALPDDLFYIWLQPPEPEPAATIPLQPNPTIKRANERQVAQIQLSSDGLRAGDVVTVFQHTDENFRIALETSTATGERYIQTQQLYTRDHRLIPRYALPTLPDPVPEMAIFSHNESNFYRFSKHEDLWKFQNALTGYEVSHDQPEVRCQFGRSLDSFVCSGRAQLWQDPIVFSSQLGDLATSVRSTHGRATTKTSSQRRGFEPSLAHTANISTTPNGLIAENIKFSALVIFTQLDHLANDNRFAVIFLELLDNVYINREACACTKNYDKCPKLVISARKNGRLPVRMVLSNMDARGPDPNSFDILPLRLPRRPDYDTIKVREGELVVLKFPNLNAKKQFDVELQYRFAVRDRQRQMQNEITKILTYNSNHPMRRKEYLAQNYARRASDTDWFRSPPPQLAEREIGPAFEIAIPQDIDLQPTRGSHRVSGSTSMSTSSPRNGSGAQSIPSSNSSNSTNNINWGLRKEAGLPPANPPRKPSVGPNGSHMNPIATQVRASVSGIQNPTTSEISDPADRLRRMATTQRQAAQPDTSSWFRTPPRRATVGDILPGSLVNRRDSTADSLSSYQTAPARTTEPTMQKQEDPGRKKTGPSKKTTGFFGAASYVIRNR